jgi:competence protein ComEC
MGHLLHTNRQQLILTAIMLFSLAAAYGTWTQSHNTSDLPENASDYALRGTITSPVEVDGDRVRFIIRTVEEREKVTVSIRLASQEEQAKPLHWRRGDLASITGELTLPPSARNFGQFDYQQYLYHQRIHRMLLVKGLESTVITANHGWSRALMMSWVDRIRDNMAMTISKLYPDDQSGFMSSMLIGLKEGMDEHTFSLFSRLGLTHIIAISGLHVAIVVGGWMGLLRFMRVTRETNIASAMVLIPVYVILSGGSPSVARAGIMAFIALYAARRRWLKDGLNIVSVTAMLMTIWNPYYIYDVSFQLSFAVTAGLIVGTPVVVRWVNLGPSWLNGTIAVTLVAQAVSFPLTIYYFNQFSLLSGLANLLLVPVFSLIVLPLGYISLIVHYVLPPVAFWVASIASWFNWGSFWFMDQLDTLPVAPLIWASPPLTWIAVYIGVLLSIFWCAGVMKEVDVILFPRLARLAKRLFLASSVIGFIWLVLGYGFLSREGISTVSFLDVGQGDSSLIRTPSNQVILVDGGGTLNFMKVGEEWRIRQDPYEVGEDLLVPLLKKRGISHIDYLIITHSDMDHIGGLQALLEEIPVKRILFNGTFRANTYTEKLFATAVEREVPLYPVWEGRELVVDEHTRLNFLHPSIVEGESGTIPLIEDQNRYSVVFSMTMYNSTFLFTGDMDAAAEQEVLAKLVEMRGGDQAAAGDEEEEIESIDVLKIAHHGSKSSTTESWLGLWQPKTAVISVGERNMYRHPSPVVIDRLVRHGVWILRTDIHGEVQMKVGEEEIERRVYMRDGD